MAIGMIPKADRRTAANLRQIRQAVGTAEDALDTAELALEIASGTLADTWNGLQLLVNTGQAPSMFPVGSRIIDTWAASAEASPLEITWDVVNYNTDGSMVLKWHYSTPDSMNFDAPEAIYYAGPDGLEAGTYHITIGSSYGTGWAQNASIEFTLSENIPAEGQIVIDCAGSQSTDPTDGRTLTTYAKGGTVAIETTTTSAGTDGTDLGTIGAETAQTPNGQLNAISRVVLGSGRWSQSAVRQWLNSESDAGEWWQPLNPWDRPPAYALTARGFLAGLPQELRGILRPDPVVSALDTVEGYTDTYETTYDRIFLPSLQEMYAVPQIADVEGEDWDYYKVLAAEIGLSGRFPTGSANKFPELITYSAASPSTAVYVWLRSANRSVSAAAWIIASTGYFNGTNANNPSKMCPCCIIRKTV